MENKGLLKKIKKAWPIALMAIAVIIIACLAFGCSGGGDNATPNAPTKTPLQVLTEEFTAYKTVTDGRLNIVEKKEVKDFSVDVANLKTRLTIVESATTPNLSGYVTISQYNALLSQIATLQASITNMSVGGVPSAQLTISVLGTIDPIVADGLYPIIVRVTNSGTATATGNIVLSMNAKTGAITLTSMAATSPDVGFTTLPTYKPTLLNCNAVTIVSDQICLVGSTSNIYRINLNVNQGGASFEWIPIITMAN